MIRRRIPHLAIAACVPVVVLAVSLTTAAAAGSSTATGRPPAQWTMFGQNLDNTASASAMRVDPHNVKELRPKWVFRTGGDISARAAVAHGVVYVPDWSGHLYAIRSKSGKLIWSKDIGTDYLGGASGTTVVSRTSPFLDTRTHTLYIGTQTGAYLLAVDAGTGALKWRTQLDTHPLAVDTGSPVAYQGVVYVGVSSIEEGAASLPGYHCCTFRGSVVAVDATTGAVRWKTYTVPPGYNGGAVWGSTIVPDAQRGVVYATTGNNYFTPSDPAYAACIAGGGTQQSCTSPDDHFDSVIALNLTTGAYVWADRFATSDDWNIACFIVGKNCPVHPGKDFDFGSGAQMFTIHTKAGPERVIGVGQKSGVYSAIDPATGHVLWATQVGPGSSVGGIEWGSATDGKRIYVSIADLFGIRYPLPDGTKARAGSWAALDPATGRIIWQVADPNHAVDLGAVTVAHGVVYAASMAGATTAKSMFALDAASGRTLWSFAAGSSVNAGAAIADDTVFWGSGYSFSHLAIPGFTGNNRFYAFTLGGT